MDNQHRQIKGYRELTQREIDLMNKIKEKGGELEGLLGVLHTHLEDQFTDAVKVCDVHGDGTAMERIDKAEPQRWISIARTHFQEGCMAATRAIAQPEFF